MRFQHFAAIFVILAGANCAEDETDQFAIPVELINQGVLRQRGLLNLIDMPG